MLGELRTAIGPIKKSMKLAFIGLCIAAIGAGVGFIFDFASGTVGLVACFLATVIGVATGWVGVVSGWRNLPASVASQIEERRAARARNASRPEIRALQPSGNRTDKY